MVFLTLQSPWHRPLSIIFLPTLVFYCTTLQEQYGDCQVTYMLYFVKREAKARSAFIHFVLCLTLIPSAGSNTESEWHGNHRRLKFNCLEMQSAVRGEKKKIIFIQWISSVTCYIQPRSTHTLKIFWPWRGIKAAKSLKKQESQGFRKQTTLCSI